MWSRKAIPRTNILTYITPENPIVEFSFYLLRNIFFEFDSVIRNTFAAIYHIRSNDSIGRASINTTSATTTMVSHGWVVVFEFDIQNKFGYKEKRTYFFTNQISVFSNPTQS